MAYEPESPKASSGSGQGAHDARPPPPQKRFRREEFSSLSDGQGVFDEVFTFEASAGDFSEALAGGLAKDCSSFFVGAPVDPTVEAWLDVTGQPPELTRQQRDALDREIPGKEALERKPEYVQGFVAVLKKGVTLV